MPHTWHDSGTTQTRRARAFQSTCHIRGMTIPEGFRPQHGIFQSTCHIRGMTLSLQASAAAYQISIHMPHTWHDDSRTHGTARTDKFQSTCHIRGMTIFSCFFDAGKVFQSTCHIRGMTIKNNAHWRQPVFQSTCHIRGMTTSKCNSTACSLFQSTCHIRGMTAVIREIHIHAVQFQSTCHIRGMTTDKDHAKCAFTYFNPHATYVA